MVRSVKQHHLTLLLSEVPYITWKIILVQNIYICFKTDYLQTEHFCFKTDNQQLPKESSVSSSKEAYIT